MSSKTKGKSRRQGLPQLAPGYHAGRTPPNAGRKLPAEVLTEQEFADLLAARGPRPVSEARDRAIIWLHYRHNLQWHQVEALHRRDYDPSTGKLNVSGGKRLPDWTIVLDAETRAILDEWLEHRRKLGVRPMTPMFFGMDKEFLGTPMTNSNWAGILQRRGIRAGIEKRVTSNGLRASGRAHQRTMIGPVEGRIESYIDSDKFRTRYPDAFDKWHGAYELYVVNPERHAGRIGLDCREALAAFAVTLAGEHDVRSDASPEQTVDRVRRVLNIYRAQLGDRVSAFLDALLAYWGTVSDLAQRQTHAAAKKNRALDMEDARRVVFQTMLVMYEIDNALRRLADGDGAPRGRESPTA